ILPSFLKRGRGEIFQLLLISKIPLYERGKLFFSPLFSKEGAGGRFSSCCSFPKSPFMKGEQ
ncbi:MAG: hypothetical protein NC902_04920, partial [Candidatus Omnitrophica bacterium]|nr:hypothetical protein [Candidatus Omnitrophota bacterium]